MRYTSLGTKMFILVIGLACLGAGCATSLNAPVVPVANESVKLGFIGPLTGDVSTVGVGDRAAIALAIDEVNASGGINGRPLEMIYEDGKCTATDAANAANKLINIDHVIGIIGGLCSTETAAFAPTAMENKTMVISYGSSAPSLSNTGLYFDRTYPSDAYQGKFAADYVYNSLRARKVAILYHVSDAGTGLRDTFSKRFQELGGQIIDVEGLPQEARDYRTALTKIKAANPDAVFFPMYVDGAIVAVKQFTELGLNIPIYGIDAFGDPKFQKETASTSVPLFYSEVVTYQNEDFKQKLLAKTGSVQVAPAAAQAYDSVMILANALKKAGTDPDTLARTVRATEIEGVSGKIAFDQNGDLVQADYRVMQIDHGQAFTVTDSIK